MKGSILPALNGITHVQKEKVQNRNQSCYEKLLQQEKCTRPIEKWRERKKLTEKGVFCISLQTLFPPSVAVMTKL